MPMGWDVNGLPGSCAGGVETPLATTKITYFPSTFPTTTAAGKETAQVAVPGQLQGFAALNGGKFEPINTVAFANNPLAKEVWPRSITTSQFSEPLVPVGSLTTPVLVAVRNSPP